MVNFHAFKILIFTFRKGRQRKQNTKKSHPIRVKRINELYFNTHRRNQRNIVYINPDYLFFLYIISQIYHRFYLQNTRWRWQVTHCLPHISCLKYYFSTLWGNTNTSSALIEGLNACTEFCSGRLSDPHRMILVVVEFCHPIML